MKLVLIIGPEGYCITLEGFRLAGPKPWGAGRIVHTFEVERADLYKLLADEEYEEEQSRDMEGT